MIHTSDSEPLYVHYIMPRKMAAGEIATFCGGNRWFPRDRLRHFPAITSPCDTCRRESMREREGSEAMMAENAGRMIRDDVPGGASAVAAHAHAPRV